MKGGLRYSPSQIRPDGALRIFEKNGSNVRPGDREIAAIRVFREQPVPPPGFQVPCLMHKVLDEGQAGSAAHKGDLGSPGEVGQGRQEHERISKGPRTDN
jgi:hypothetical protein